MYVRFVTPCGRLRRGLDPGLFGAAYDIKHGRIEAPWPLRDAIREQLFWFDNQLPAPPGAAFRVKSRGRFWSDGICWFKGKADLMVAEAFVLARLLMEAGVPVSKLVTQRPGQILFGDDYQIVAKPVAATPVTFH